MFPLGATQNVCTPPFIFSHFLNCTNGNKSRKASQLTKKSKILIFFAVVLTFTLLP